MKSSHQTQQYRLEDSFLKYFSEQTDHFEGQIQGFQSDVGIVAANPHLEGRLAGIEVDGKLYMEKGAAEEALLLSCNTVLQRKVRRTFFAVWLTSPFGLPFLTGSWWSCRMWQMEH